MTRHIRTLIGVIDSVRIIPRRRVVPFLGLIKWSYRRTVVPRVDNLGSPFYASRYLITWQTVSVRPSYDLYVTPNLLTFPSPFHSFVMTISSNEFYSRKGQTTVLLSYVLTSQFVISEISYRYLNPSFSNRVVSWRVEHSRPSVFMSRKLLPQPVFFCFPP